MAKKKGEKKETKSEFLRKVLTKNPDLDHRQVNLRWSRTGHSGEISSPLYYKVRGELGIKTEWVRVKESGPEIDQGVVTRPEGKNRPNDDLVEAADAGLYAAKRRGRNTVVEHAAIRATDRMMVAG